MYQAEQCIRQNFQDLGVFIVASQAVCLAMARAWQAPGSCVMHHTLVYVICLLRQAAHDP